MYKGYYKSPIGMIQICANDEGITELEFVDDSQNGFSNDEYPYIRDGLKQLEEYFCGKRKSFDLKLCLSGTEFQKQVWQELQRIPYGETVSYKDIAVRVNNEKAVRAVGGANNRNKIGIIIPCHRVIGTNGKLVGYAGGLWRKEWLLGHERSK